MNKWPRNLGGSKSYYPLPESFSCHTKLVVTYFVWAARWGWRTTQSLLCHLVLKLCITHSTDKQRKKNYQERGKCGSKGKTSLLNIRSSFEFQHISEWIIFFNLFNYANSHHALVVLAVFSLYMYDSRIAIATLFLISLQLLTINMIRQGQRWSKSWSKLYRFKKRLLRVNNGKKTKRGLLDSLPQRMVIFPKEWSLLRHYSHSCEPKESWQMRALPLECRELSACQQIHKIQGIEAYLYVQIKRYLTATLLGLMLTAHHQNQKQVSPRFSSISNRSPCVGKFPETWRLSSSQEGAAWELSLCST